MLKLSTKNLADLKDSFPKLYVVGSGPTNFDYKDIEKITAPIIFINDMAQFAITCASEEQYFLSHHLSKYRDVSPITIWISKLYSETSEWNIVGDSRFSPKNDFISVKAIMGDEADDNFFVRYPWLLNKDEVIKKNTILGFFGTITTVLYMSWFMGCSEPRMIGCDPNSLTDTHDKRIGGAMIYEPAKIKRNQKALTKKLDLNPIYI